MIGHADRSRSPFYFWICSSLLPRQRNLTFLLLMFFVVRFGQQAVCSLLLSFEKLFPSFERVRSAMIADKTCRFATVAQGDAFAGWRCFILLLPSASPPFRTYLHDVLTTAWQTLARAMANIQDGALCTMSRQDSAGASTGNCLYITTVMQKQKQKQPGLLQGVTVTATRVASETS